MIEAEEIGAARRRLALGCAVVLRTDEEAAPRPLLRRVGQCERRGYLSLAAEQRAAAPSARALERLRAVPALVPEALGQVLVAAVAEDHDDHGVRGVARHAQRAGEVG